MQGVVAHAEIAPLLQNNFIALASDCDAPEDAVIELAQHLESASMLPFVIFCDAEGKFLRGSSGAVNPLTFKRTLEELISD